MNSFSIAFKLFKTNVRTYGYYLAVMIFAVAVYYDFMSLKYNPEVLQTQQLLQVAKGAAQTTSFVLLVFLVFFMWYSSTFFLKQRKKEIGIYSLMGISNSKIGMVFAFESVIVGVTAVGAGLLIGILLSKLFIMVLAKAALLKVTVKFTIPFNGIKEVIVTFGAIFCALSVRSYVNVAKSRLIDLISDSKKQEKAPKLRVVRGIFSILLISAGYFLSIYVFNTPNFIIASLVVTILVVLGTYWFFGAFMSIVMRFLLNSKSVLYKGVRIVSINNIAFRLKANYRSLAMLAVMSATTITAFGTSLSLKYYVESTHNTQFPYSFSYISGDRELNEKVIETIKDSGHKLLLAEQVNYLLLESVKIQGISSIPTNMAAVKYSDFVRITRDLKVKNGESLIERAKLTDNEIIYIASPNNVGATYTYKGKEISLNGAAHTIKEDWKTPLLGDGAAGGMSALVIKDEEYERLKGIYKEVPFNGFLVNNAEKSEKLATKLYEIIPKQNRFFAYVAMYRYKYAFIGLFYFLGVFMSIVFILATGSIMYFKLLSEALSDKAKYEILSKIGMSGKEIEKAVSKQVGISLILPLIVAVVHSMFAINVLQNLLHYNLIIPTLAAIGIFSLIYAVFYAVTTKRFLTLVCYKV